VVKLNHGKLGRIFVILMIALIAYGSASALIFFTEIPKIEVPQVIKAQEEKMNTIGNPTFQPVWVEKHAIPVKNNTTTQNETNRTNMSTNKIKP